MHSFSDLHSANDFISPDDPWSLIGTAQAPHVVDVRCRDADDGSFGMLPAVAWRDPAAARHNWPAKAA
jgi:hypothetical protein